MSQTTTLTPTSISTPLTTAATTTTTTHSKTSEITHQTYLFGNPISHSLSPLLHNTIYTHLNLPTWTYTLHETPSIASCISLLKQQTCIGAAVTMPHKVTVIPYLDELDAAGKAIGAVNTIYFEETEVGKRKMIGTNTDCIGIREALLHAVSFDAKAGGASSPFRSQPALVIGGGGTSRAAVYALGHFLRCSPIYIVNRDEAEVRVVQEGCKAGFGVDIIHISSAAQAADRQAVPVAPRVVVSAIPDFEPATRAEKEVRRITETLLDRGREESEGKGGVLLEMCYTSPRTRITNLTEEKGWTAVRGIQAMVWQGVEQDRIWTGRSADEMGVEDVKKVIEAANERMRAYGHA